MPKRILGRAQYRALRSGGITRLIAVGETPHWNDKTDFEELPFLVHPPIYGFFFVQQDNSIPAERPFAYEESISYPLSAKTVRIQDALGLHQIPIREVHLPVAPSISPGVEESGYCVFHWVGTSRRLIAKADASVPAVYERVFGPAAYAECLEQAPIKFAVEETIKISELETLQRTKAMLRREWNLGSEPLSTDNLRKAPPAGLGKNDSAIRALESPIEAIDFADVSPSVNGAALVRAKTVADLSDVIWQGIPEENRPENNR